MKNWQRNLALALALVAVAAVFQVMLVAMKGATLSQMDRQKAEVVKEMAQWHFQGNAAAECRAQIERAQTMDDLAMAIVRAKVAGGVFTSVQGGEEIRKIKAKASGRVAAEASM